MVDPPRPADDLDRLISRAVADPDWGRRLVADPGGALALVEMRRDLKQALAVIRARDLGEFAVRALDAQYDLSEAPGASGETRLAGRSTSVGGDRR